MIFVFWLALPSLRGSTYIYYQFILPLLKTEEEKIDLFIKNFKDHFIYAGSSGISAAHSVLVTTVTTLNPTPDQLASSSDPQKSLEKDSANEAKSTTNRNSFAG